MATYKRRRSLRYSRPSKRRKIYKRSRRIFKRRANRNRKAISRSVRRGYGFGETKVVYCKWVATEPLAPQLVQATATAGTPIMVNSAYDPWSGVIGAFNVTSAGFDLHARLYGRYVVLGAKLVATFRPISSPTLDIPFKVGLRKDDAAGLGSYNAWWQLATDPDTHMKTLVTTAKNKSSATVVMTYSPRKEFGLKDPRDSGYQTYGISAAFNGSPTRAVYVTPWYHSLESAIPEVQNWTVEYKLYQKVLFLDRNDLISLNNSDSLIQD